MHNTNAMLFAQIHSNRISWCFEKYPNISSKKQCPDISDPSRTSHTCLRAPKSPIDLNGLFTSFLNQYLHCSWSGCTSSTACQVCK